MNNILDFGFFPLMPAVPQAGPGFVVLRAEGEEGISRLYSFKIRLGVENYQSVPDIINRLLRNRVQLDLNYLGYRKNISGIVTEATFLGIRDGRCYLSLELQPKISLLKNNVGSAVFLNRSVPEVIGEVIESETAFAGDIAVNMSNIRPEDYPKREMIMRYNESSWDFICRLMEECGIYFYFKFSGGNEGEVIMPAREEMVLSDRSSSEAAAPVPPFRQTGNGNSDAMRLTSPSLAYRPVTKRICSDSYDLDSTRSQKIYPRADGETNLAESLSPFLGSTACGSSVMYDSALNGEEVKRLNRIRVERAAKNAVTLKAEGYCPLPSAGQLITVSDLAESPSSSFTLTGIRHLAHQSAYYVSGLAEEEDNQETGYRCVMTAIPSELQYRPDLIAPVPKIFGCIPAMVEGADASPFSPYMDELGRYRIKFPFDRQNRLSGNSSCWIKLMTPYGGNVNTVGMHFPLLKDTQVLVGFVDGNVDRPFILGTLQDGGGSIVNSSRITSNIIRTPSGNLLAMNDSASRGGESILIKNSYGYQSRGPSTDDLMDNL